MKVTWKSYEFTVCQHSDNWNDVGGLYIFAGQNQQGQWVALYIGQADSFKNRIPSHERHAEAVRLGSTRVHAMVEGSQARRDSIEKELIQHFQPRLNTQLR